MKKGPIVEKTVDFSILIIKYCDFLVSKKKFVVANQLLKSATSIGANVFEAQHAESRIDFIHKIKIASKEASETLYWLILCEQMDDFEVDQKLLSIIKEIMSILSAIIFSARKNSA